MLQYLCFVFMHAILLLVLLIGTYFLLKPNKHFESDLIGKIGGYLNDSNIRDLDLVSFDSDQLNLLSKA